MVFVRVFGGEEVAA